MSGENTERNPVDTSEFEYLKENFHVIVVDVLTIFNVNCICGGKINTAPNTSSSE